MSAVCASTQTETGIVPPLAVRAVASVGLRTMLALLPLGRFIDVSVAGMVRLRVLVPVLRVSRYNNLEPVAVPPTNCVGELMVAPVPLPATIVAVLSMATPAMVAALTFTLNVTVQVLPAGTVILVTVNVPALKLKAGVVTGQLELPLPGANMLSVSMASVMLMPVAVTDGEDVSFSVMV